MDEKPTFSIEPTWYAQRNRAGQRLRRVHPAAATATTRRRGVVAHNFRRRPAAAANPAKVLRCRRCLTHQRDKVGKIVMAAGSGGLLVVFGRGAHLLGGVIGRRCKAAPIAAAGAARWQA